MMKRNALALTLFVGSIVFAVSSIAVGQSRVGTFARLFVDTAIVDSSSATPESVTTAPIGSLITRTAAPGVLYQKVSGSGSTGWMPLGGAETDSGNSSTAITFNFQNGLVFRTTLTDNATFTFSNPVVGAEYVIFLTQDGTGSRTVTWPAAVKWPGGMAPTLSTMAAALDMCRFRYTGASSNVYAGSCELDIQ